MENSRDTDIDFKKARAAFPEDEGKHEWLPMLLDAYAMVDTGVETAIKEHEAEHGVKLACREGCDSCCRSQTDVPLYPLELVGIYWYAAERITGEARKALKERLLFYAKGRPCPFLAEGSCLIHKVRPVSCRQFNVFVKPCGPGEDPYFTRREEVLTPIREFTVRAFKTMLPFYGAKEATDDEANRVIHEEIINLKKVDWKKLYALMEGFESENPEVLG
jgi:Fe-S-cluster containining protein